MSHKTPTTSSISPPIRTNGSFFDHAFKLVLRLSIILTVAGTTSAQSPPPGTVGQWSGPWWLRLFPAPGPNDPPNIGKEAVHDTSFPSGADIVTLENREVGAATLIPPVSVASPGPYAGHILCWNLEIVESTTNPPPSGYANIPAAKYKLFHAWIINPNTVPPRVKKLNLDNNIVIDSPFCSGFTWDKDGKLITLGGDNVEDPPHNSYYLDPATLSQNPEVYFQLDVTNNGHDAARFYPSFVTMGDGSHVGLGGYLHGSNPEIWSDLLSAGPTLSVGTQFTREYITEQTIAKYFGQFPRMFSTKSGRLFVAFDNNTNAMTAPYVVGTWDYLPGTLDSLRTLATPPKDRFFGSAAIMEEQDTNNPGSILERIFAVCGSEWTIVPQTSIPPGAPTLKSIDEWQYNSAGNSGNWYIKGQGVNGRFMANAVILPDRTLFVVGGSSSDSSVYSTPAPQHPATPIPIAPITYAAPVQTPEIFDPGFYFTPPHSGSFSSMANHTEHRMDHSTAVLLPDGRIFTIGGLDNDSPSKVAPGNENTLRPGDTAEIFSPPYLFNGTPPVVTSVTYDSNGDTWSYGQSYTIGVSSPTDMTTNKPKVVLMRPCTVTHNFDFDQRYVEMAVGTVQGSSGNYTIPITVPTATGAAPPGWYMIFVIDQAGGLRIPSTAAWVKLH
ncbi:MAG: DUF1929 domain-containing protein [Planctomycetes bacterium]|nr:DUF1929 domain-containing protein [Planctomycetota bacterium]